MTRGMSRAVRLQRIETILLNMPDGCTIPELAEMLHVHRTTIWRDITEISRHAPVQESDNRYSIDRSTYVSSVRLDSGESLMLYLALRRVMRSLSNVPPMMMPALEKVSSAFSRPTKQLAEALVARQLQQPVDRERAGVWETLVQAWMECITVRITYRAIEDQLDREYEVQPYLFEPAVFGEGLYLIGYSRTHDSPRAFKVARITHAVLTTEQFVRPENSAAEKILHRVWGIWYDDKPVEVRLRFRDSTIAGQVRDTLWYPSQKTRDLPGGGVEWSVHTANVAELVPWIRSWGPACEVLEPPDLREQLAELEDSLGGSMMDSHVAARVSASEAFFDTLQGPENGHKFLTCLQCSACSGICPLSYTMEFPPRRMIAALRAGMLDTIVASDTVWMCVACNACTTVCPQTIPVTTGLMTRAKEEALLAGNVPPELQDALENSQRYGNPLGESPRKRAEWTQGIDPSVKIMSVIKRPVDVLWFVGDYASYHPRAQRATRALARILNVLGVDFGILGPEETSDGDSQRLAGERGLFEMLAEKNGRALEKYEFGEIVTTDPHAYNALKHEYPALGISYPVKHYTEFLAERLDKLAPRVTGSLNATVTFHDPCYLGRVNGIYDQPRDLLRAIPGVELVEMSHTRSNSLCCGGGGGGMWLDGFQWEKTHVRLSEWRVQEALEASAADETRLLPPAEQKRRREREERRERRQQPESQKATKRILAVACPYEAPRFEDAAKVVEGAGSLMVKDIAELLAESMKL